MYLVVLPDCSWAGRWPSPVRELGAGETEGLVVADFRCWEWDQFEPWSLKEGRLSLFSQTCLALAPLPPKHLIPEQAWEMGSFSEPVSIQLLDPSKAGEDPRHGDY